MILPNVNFEKKIDSINDNENITLISCLAMMYTNLHECIYFGHVHKK